MGHRRKLTAHLLVLFQSTHPVRGGTTALWQATEGQTFQSTHPVRGGTALPEVHRFIISISIHPPREGWDKYLLQKAMSVFISIHPPREGWDINFLLIQGSVSQFQSTHPVRGGTFRLPSDKKIMQISIHPPREGWDRGSTFLTPCPLNFNPPTP